MYYYQNPNSKEVLATSNIQLARIKVRKKLNRDIVITTVEFKYKPKFR